MSSFRSRRAGNRKHIQTVKQVATERPGADSNLQVTVRGCDHPDVSAYRAGPADTLKLMLLQNTQEGDLSHMRKFSNFIEEDSASICQLKPAQALLNRAREGTLFREIAGALV